MSAATLTLTDGELTRAEFDEWKRILIDAACRIGGTRPCSDPRKEQIDPDVKRMVDTWAAKQPNEMIRSILRANRNRPPSHYSSAR
jgi:hypothetical protein